MLPNIRAWLMRPWTEPPPLDRFDGANELEEHRKERKRLSENNYNRSQSLAGWLFATLAGTNGAAAVALLSSEKVRNPDPAIAFAAGVFLAIAAGRYSWREAQDRSGLHYLESLQSHQLTDEGRAKFKLWKRRSRRFNYFARWLHSASLIAFLIGSVWAAMSIR